MVTWPLLGTIQGLYLPNAWSHSLSKRHTFGVSAFHRYHWFMVKLFPVGCAQDSRRVPWNCKKLLFFGSGSPHATSLKFFTIAPVLISTLTACHRNRGDPRLYIGLQVHYKYYRKKHSRSGLAWSCPCANRSLISLSRPRSVFRTTNRCVQNFIYIGWDLALWGPKTYFGVKTDNGQAYAWLSKKSHWYHVCVDHNKNYVQIRIAICGVHMAESLLSGLVITFQWWNLKTKKNLKIVKNLGFTRPGWECGAMCESVAPYVAMRENAGAMRT